MNLKESSISFSRLFEAQLAASPDDPKLLSLVSSTCIKRGDFKRANILLGRSITLGVRTFKVYSQRGFALLKLAETECLQFPESAMLKFIESAVNYDKAITLGLLSGQATIPILLNASRSFFRAGSWEQATRLLSHLVELLPTSNIPEELMEVCLMASQSLYELNDMNHSIEYLRHVFTKANDVHLLKRRKTNSSGDSRNDGSENIGPNYDSNTDSDSDTDSDNDIGDVLVKRHGNINERVCALILGILFKHNINSTDGTDSNTIDSDPDLNLNAAVHYSFFRHRTASFAAIKQKSIKQKTRRKPTNQKTHTSQRKQKQTLKQQFLNNKEQFDPSQWSEDPHIWIHSGDTCIRKGQPVFACLCYREAASKSQLYEEKKPWWKSLSNRLPTPPLALSLTKYSHALMLSNKTDEAIHAAHCSHQHFRWQLTTRNFLSQWEPKTWTHLFLIQHVAATTLQRRVRGMIVRNTDNTDRAARSIQSTYRMIVVKAEYKRQRKASTMLQTSWRGVAERMGMVWKRRRKAKAAITIESIFRGYRGRIKARMQRYLKFEKAYNLIIRIGRGHVGRQRWQDRAHAIVLLQSAWRGYECRLTMWAIGVLPLIRWTQIGSCFVPITYIRRPATFKVLPDQTNGGKIMLLSNAPLSTLQGPVEFEHAPDIDLTVAGRRLIPNVQLDTVHNATIMSRIEKVDEMLKQQIQRAKSYHEKNATNEKLTEKNTPDIIALGDAMAKQQEEDIANYLKSTAKVKEFLQTAETAMDRAKRRLKSITSTWLNAFALCIRDLNTYGHQPLTFWRVRVQLNLEAAKEDLIRMYGELPTRDILRAILNVHSDLNLLTADQTRKRMKILINIGESFERRNNRQWRSLDDEFRGTRKRLRHAVKAALALKRRVKRLNEERKQKRQQLNALIQEIETTKYGSNITGTNFTDDSDDINMNQIVLKGAVDTNVKGDVFGQVLVGDVARQVGEAAAAAAATSATSATSAIATGTSSLQPATEIGDETNSAILTPLPTMSSSSLSSSSAINSLTLKTTDHRPPLIHSETSSINNLNNETTLLLENESNVQEKISPQEMALRKRCDILVHRRRTRSNVDHLLAEWRRLLAKCASIGAWRLALECHICMSKQHLPRDESTYRNVVTAVKHAKHMVPSQVIVAILDEMIDEDMAEQRTFHVCMGAVARNKKAWRHSILIFQKMRQNGHKATSASYEILTQACTEANPTECYDALKYAGVPEYFAYSIGRRSKVLQ
jgi:tetratricopeptide (TPR) repeat protein